jgi:hypothetical protein
MNDLFAGCVRPSLLSTLSMEINLLSTTEDVRLRSVDQTRFFQSERARNGLMHCECLVDGGATSEVAAAARLERELNPGDAASGGASFASSCMRLAACSKRTDVGLIEAAVRRYGLL